MEMLRAQIKGHALMISIKEAKVHLLNVKKIDSELKSILGKPENNHNEIILDLSSVSEIDSSGFALLVRAHLDASRKNKKFVLEKMNPLIMDALVNAKLLKDFNIR